MEKRAQGMPLNVIVTAVIVLVVLVVVISIFTRSTVEQSEVLYNNIEKLKDCDCDNVANFLDKCPCDVADDNGKNGCPSNLIIKEMGEIKYPENPGYSCFEPSTGKCKNQCNVV